MTRSESKLISAFRAIAKNQPDVTKVTISFIDLNNPNTHIGHIYIGKLSEKEIVAVYRIEDFDDLKKSKTS